MGIYLLKRILWFIPTIFVLSLLLFILSQNAPGDPVSLSSGQNFDENSLSYNESFEANHYRQIAHQFGLDLPLFYFAIEPAAYPDTLYKIMPLTQQSTIKKHISRCGNPETVLTYYTQLNQLANLAPSRLSSDTLKNVLGFIQQLKNQDNPEIITNQTNSLGKFLHNWPEWTDFQNISTSLTTSNPKKLWLPAFHWYGTQNRFHRWWSNLIKGDLGVSFTDQGQVSTRIWQALKVTILMNLTAILLSFGLSIPLGVYLAMNHNNRKGRILNTFLFTLHAIPVFWLATILVNVFTTPDYGLQIFPSIGLSSLPESASFIQRFLDYVSHLLLPIICLVYGSLAYISRQLQGAMVQNLGMDYVKTARMKGLSWNQVAWKHAFPNSKFPLITLFAAIFPAAFAGSLVIEVIFNIPGMGRLVYDAIGNRDWPVVYSVLFFGALITMTANLLADILYRISDPRVRFSNE